MSEPIETMPVGSWGIAHRDARSLVVYREDDSHWCDATGRTVVSMDGATWSGTPDDAPPPDSKEQQA